jgi:hypothetical protein
MTPDVPSPEWTAWQREHSAALAALQDAQRAYHRTIAGGAFADLSDPAAVEAQNASLHALEATRVALDAIRAKKPDA